MLVSQCSKQALPATRRMLDQFAERKGDRTWLTPITEAGLQTLHQLLRQQARRNTAIACHWIKGGQIELLWIVGNRHKFNRQGTVATNYTGRNILQAQREEGWRHTESIALLAALAGLFHDFGKANTLFQQKLTGKRRQKAEPIRHEWLSVRLFEAFVADRSDKEWLSELGNVDGSSGQRLLESVYRDNGVAGRRARKNRLLDGLGGRPVAWAVAWLILSHHRLPFADKSSAQGRADEVKDWLRQLQPVWNSPQAAAEHSGDDWSKLWQFKDGLPCNSDTWRRKAHSLSERALKHPGLFSDAWPDNSFALHLARCALMLADHYYSGHDKTPRWQSPDYPVFANTLWAETAADRPLNQQLDEHCIAVSHHSYLIAKSLPLLPELLPTVGDIRALRKPAKGPFAWQNKAFSLAVSMRDSSRLQGGFIVNMASTGTGKTLANARIAYGLSDERRGCRFSVLLGLRTLTLQTGSALRQRTGLGQSELAVLVGSSAVRELFDQDQLARQQSQSEQQGSESAQALFAEHDYISYDGELDKSRIGAWLRQKSSQRGGATLHALLSAPVLVSTIDHLMPATESARGGQQMAPMLRLLSSDTVFDEPDDFDLADLPALCRLVHFCGLLGSRVVFSSATLPPSLLQALFAAYSAGRREYNLATLGHAAAVCCGWVDEHSSQTQLVEHESQFQQLHAKFVQTRLRYLAEQAPRRRAEIIPIQSGHNTAVAATAATVAEQIQTLHAAHHQRSPDGGKCLSVGLLRMANIDPLVAVARALAAESPVADCRLHLCVYHSRHPLFRRAEIERHLDVLLDRRQPEQIWQLPSVQRMLKQSEQHHIVVVLATAVAEVGRDHDYDWAIVEPSSMRSIIQLAGRVRRHRPGAASEQPNMLLLDQNIRAQEGQPVCFHKPGYERKSSTLQSHTLQELLLPEHYQHPSAACRIGESDDLQPQRSLVDLEQVATRRQLFGDGSGEDYAAQLWWREPVRWCYQLQAKTRFRAGRAQDHYALLAEDAEDPLVFNKYSEGDWVQEDGIFERVEPQLAQRVQAWPELSDRQLLTELDQKHDDLTLACKRFMSVSLDRPGQNAAPQRWKYHAWLGVFRTAD